MLGELMNKDENSKILNLGYFGTLYLVVMNLPQIRNIIPSDQPNGVTSHILS